MCDLSAASICEMKGLVSVFFLVVIVHHVLVAAVLPFQDPTLSWEKRLDDLVSFHQKHFKN